MIHGSTSMHAPSRSSCEHIGTKLHHRKRKLSVSKSLFSIDHGWLPPFLLVVQCPVQRCDHVRHRNKILYVYFSLRDIGTAEKQRGIVKDRMPLPNFLCQFYSPSSCAESTAVPCRWSLSALHFETVERPEACASKRDGTAQAPAVYCPSRNLNLLCSNFSPNSGVRRTRPVLFISVLCNSVEWHPNFTAVSLYTRRTVLDELHNKWTPCQPIDLLFSCGSGTGLEWLSRKWSRAKLLTTSLRKDKVHELCVSLLLFNQHIGSTLFGLQILTPKCPDKTN